MWFLKAQLLQEEENERAILVALELESGEIIDGKTEGERSLDELEELAKTAGLTVVDKVLQRKSSIDSAFYIGKGKLEKLSLLRQSLDANLIVFDDELSGAQVRNIENITGVKVIDRTVLILDIFAKRAKSKEGKIQVELAQLKYRLPRLTGMGTALSRLGGGIGTRGPGEKKLEIDKRHIRRRIELLEKELEEISKRRNLTREKRKKNNIPVVALVGYTNAGKSTLMNKLCNSSVFAENMLFATLDPAARNMVLPDGRNVMLVDTVGFIRKLPHELVEAFKSTLEEAVHADVLLHVVDISNSEAESQIKVSENILNSLGAMNKPVITILNKCDLVKEDTIHTLGLGKKNTYEVSAITGKGIDNIINAIMEAIPAREKEVCLQVPYNEAWVLSYVHDKGKVISVEYGEEAISLKAVLGNDALSKVERFINHITDF